MHIQEKNVQLEKIVFEQLPNLLGCAVEVQFSLVVVALKKNLVEKHANRMACSPR